MKRSQRGVGKANRAKQQRLDERNNGTTGGQVRNKISDKVDNNCNKGLFGPKYSSYKFYKNVPKDIQGKNYLLYKQKWCERIQGGSFTDNSNNRRTIGRTYSGGEMRKVLIGRYKKW